MRLLLVEDDPLLRESLTLALRHAGYKVDAAVDGVAADAALTTKEAYSVVVLDLGLPRMEGLQVLSALRARRDSTPVLILTAMDEVDTKVRALDRGADDYLVKPFSIAELEARLRVMLRRSVQRSDNLMYVGSLIFNGTSRTLTTDRDERIELSAREIALLELLMRHAPHWVSKDTLTDQLGSWDAELTPNAIEVAVHRLRKRLQPHNTEIIVVRGLGYTIQSRSA